MDLMNIACLDLEGVIFPEIWINLAEKTGIEALKKTTRDEPDYNVLMQYRLAILQEAGLGLGDIQELIASLNPLEGAVEFLAELRTKMQVILLSDTFVQFMYSVIPRLNYPLMLCNELLVDDQGCISGYRLRQENGKYHVIQALHKLQLKVFAAGDSYNDVAMLQEADRATFFRAPESILQQYPEMPYCREFSELMEFFVSSAATA